MELRDYLRVIRRWKWLIVLVTLVAGITAAAVSAELPKSYQAQATGVVTLSPLLAASGVDFSQASNIDQLANTYVGLVNSEPVRQKLIASGIPRTSGELKSHILALREPNTTLINVAIVDRDPAVANLIASHIISAFNDSLQELQSNLGVVTRSKLDPLVPWEVVDAKTLPVTPDTTRNVEFGLAGGLILSFLLAFVLERLDNTIKSESDVAIKLKAPLLGTVVLRPKSGTDMSGSLVTVGAAATNDPLAEQYRAVRTNLMFSRLDRELRTIVVTSTRPGEGKTTTASNLAVVVAQAGHRVILVDGDFRKPAVHRVFGTSRRIGLGNLLLGDATESQALVESGVPNLQLLSTGPIPPNPSELLGSKSMQRILARLSQRADIVIIDSPPASAVTDPTVIAALVDGVIMVVERGGPSVPTIMRSLETMEGVGSNLVGVVLNKVGTSEGGLDYYYAYGEGPPEGESPAGIPPVGSGADLPETQEIA